MPEASKTATASDIRSSVAWLSSSSERYLRSSMIARRDVLEQEGERALRVRPAGDAEDLAGGQLPVLLVGARRARPPRARRACAARRRSPSARASAGSRAAARGSRAGDGRPASQTASIFTRSVSAGLKRPSRRFLSKTARPIGRWAKVSVSVSTKRRSDASAATRSSASSAKPSGLAGRRRGSRLSSYQCGSASSRPGTDDPAAAAGAAGGQRHLLEHVAEGVGDAVVGQVARRRVEAVAVGGVGPGDLAVRRRGSRPSPARGRARRAGSAARRRRGPSAASASLQRARLLARRADREEGGAAARLADDLEGGAVAARAVVAEAGAVEHQRLEVRPAGSGQSAARCAASAASRGAAGGRPSSSARAGSVSAFRLAPLIRKSQAPSRPAAGAPAARARTAAAARSPRSAPASPPR